MPIILQQGVFISPVALYSKLSVSKSPESLLDDKVLVDYGITVDKNLVVTKVEPKSNADIFGIKIGDKILGYNKESVSSREELLEKISDLQNFVLLFTRNDFQFFARVPK